MAYSEAKKKATIKYQKKTYDRIELKVKKGEKEKIKARAAELGISVNTYMIELIKKDLEEIWMYIVVSIQSVQIYGCIFVNNAYWYIVVSIL